MKHLLIVIFVSLVMGLSAHAQNPQKTAPNASGQTQKQRKPPFRATKDQIVQVQRMLKVAETGKMDDAFRAEIRKYQASNGLRSTGTLNRATLEKMGVVLTEKQSAIPVDPNSFASSDSKRSNRGPVFRATKDQITAAQRMLKLKGHLASDPTGKLDPDTRAALRLYQEANGIKATGTLNAATLEKMGIALTEQQKANAISGNQTTGSSQ